MNIEHWLHVLILCKFDIAACHDSERVEAVEARLFVYTGGQGLLDGPYDDMT